MGTPQAPGGNMRKRNIRIEIYFNEDELKKLDSDREKLGLSRSEYIRGLIGRNVVDKKQNQELLNMFLEANKINSNINRLNELLEENDDAIPFVSSQAKVSLDQLNNILNKINNKLN